MNKKIIQTYEHETLKTPKDLSKYYYNLLISFGEKHDYKYFSIGKDNIKFTSYVGVIQVNNLTIEILPKVNKSNYFDCRDLLITMLKKSGYISINYHQNANQKCVKESLLELFFKEFLKEAKLLNYQGLKKQYRKILKNRKALKGTLDFQKNLSKNFIHKERFYTSADNYDRDNVYNQIIKKALVIIQNNTSNIIIKKDANNLLSNLTDISNVNIFEKNFDLLSYNRETERYKKCVEMAKLIILNIMPNLSGGKNSILALLFDMNKLFEQFVTKELSKSLIEYDVLAQKPQQSLILNKSKKESFYMKPDITIKKEKKIISIFDTKWKLLDINDKKRGIGQSDLYQLYTYSNEYNCKNVALIYPKWKEEQMDVEKYNFNKCGNEISIISVDLTAVIKTKSLNSFIKKSIIPLLESFPN